MLWEKRLPHDVARDRRQLLFLLLDRGDLDFFLTRDRFFRHGRVQQYVRKQFDAQFYIGFRDFDRKIEAVVAGIARNRAADRFNLVCNLFCGPRFGSFEQHFRHQTRDAISLRRFGEETAAENGPHRYQWQPPIFANEKAQAI